MELSNLCAQSKVYNICRYIWISLYRGKYYWETRYNGTDLLIFLFLNEIYIYFWLNIIDIFCLRMRWKYIKNIDSNTYTPYWFWLKKTPPKKNIIYFNKFKTANLINNNSSSSIWVLQKKKTKKKTNVIYQFKCS